MTEEESKPESRSAEQSTIHEWVAAEDGVCEAYSDWFHINWMPLTVRIRFAQIVADPRISPDKATWVLDERVALTLPWVTVKSLNEMFTKLITTYEKTNGEIIVPTIPSLE
jgi:hypothetical protein